MTDVYVMGTPYSGSTLLANALGGHPSVFHAGEVSRLPAFGLGPAAEECMLCRVSGRTCPVWTPRLSQAIQESHPAQASRLIRQADASDVVVDSSKHVAWVQQAVAGDLARDIRLILTLRSPFAFAASVGRTDGMPPWQAANQWRDTVVDALRFAASVSLPLMIVRYEDFSRNPEPLLKRLCDHIGVAWAPETLRFWNEPAHSLGGNPHAYLGYPGYHAGLDPTTEFAADQDIVREFAEHGFGGWVDERWRQELAPEAIEQIVHTPLLPTTLSLVGYSLVRLLQSPDQSSG